MKIKDESGRSRRGEKKGGEKSVHERRGEAEKDRE
jgi:hypothetical protein